MWLLGGPLFGFLLFAGISLEDSSLASHLPSSLTIWSAIFDGLCFGFQVSYLHLATICNVHGFIINFILLHSSASPYSFEFYIRFVPKVRFKATMIFNRFLPFPFLDLSILIRFSILLNPPLPKKKKKKLISCNSRVEVDIQFEYKLNK